MKHCIKIPRFLLPREDFEKWCVPAGNRFPLRRSGWDGFASGNSALGAICPEDFLAEAEERVSGMREYMYAALEEDVLEKLNRGMILVERDLPSGTRRGLLACIDLEQFTFRRGGVSPVRATQETDPVLVGEYLSVRRQTPLEFTHTVALYRDKKDKVMRALDPSELEKLYEFRLPLGGSVRGYFIPDYIAAEVAEDLHSRGEPCFAVVEGNHALAAAKLYWDEISERMGEDEKRRHPARFAMAEFVNAETVALAPVHRLVRGIEPEAFCDFFSRTVKCERDGGLLRPKLTGSAAVAAADEAIARFLRANSGSVVCVPDEEELAAFCDGDSVGVAFRAAKDEDVFAAVKGGKLLPKKSLCLGGNAAGRYCFEGREIGYD